MINRLKLRRLILLMIISFCPTFLMAEQESRGEVSGEVLLQTENTSGLPNGREDLERTRLFAWLELTAPLSESFSFGASVYGNAGNDEKDENRRNLDNSESNTAEIDQFYLDWNFSEDSFMRAGKHYIPVKLSSMLWDKDTKTLGISVRNDWLDLEDNEYRFSIGGYKVDHIFSDESHMAFVDFHYSMPVADAFITTGVMLMSVTDTEFLIQDNVRRTNTETALNEGFEIGLVDFSIAYSLFDQSAVTGVEASQNFALDDENQAYRFNFILGDNAVEGGWQFNLHYQDIERDAAVAAYVDDDWWFATRMSGYRVSASYGVTEDTFVQASYFNEELEIFNTKRIFLEIRSFF